MVPSDPAGRTSAGRSASRPSGGRRSAGRPPTGGSRAVGQERGAAKGAPPKGRPAGLVPPARAQALAGWALLPLRAFLGVTFLFAGLQKLANPDFFNSASPSGIQAQLIAAERVSPLHLLLGHLLQFATPLGVLIALGEVAVGLGTLLGLWTRLAALGGVLLSLTLFLTVSFHASPYYTGADIVFVFAWIPLIVAGSGGVWSLDGLIATRSRREHGLGPGELVAVPFATIQQVCGHYEDGRCDARGGAACEAAPCPFLAGADRPTGRAGRPDDVDRRSLVLGGMAVAAAAVVGLLVAGVTAALGRLVGGAPALASGTVTLGGGHSKTGSATTSPAGPTSTTAPSNPAATSPSTTAPARPPGTAIGPARVVPVGGAASFKDPGSGDPALVVQPQRGTFLAYDAVCPHAGCTVGYSAAAKLLVCPCHGSEFDVQTGNVLVGPAPTGLSPIAVAEGSDGQLYVAH